MESRSGHFLKSRVLINSNGIREGKLKLEQAQSEQEALNKYLKYIKIGSNSEEQRKTLANINMLFNERKNTVKTFHDYSSVVLEARHRSVKGEGIKILTPKQML